MGGLPGRIEGGGGGEVRKKDEVLHSIPDGCSEEELAHFTKIPTPSPSEMAVNMVWLPDGDLTEEQMRQGREVRGKFFADLTQRIQRESGERLADLTLDRLGKKRKGVAEARTKRTVRSSERLDDFVRCALEILESLGWKPTLTHLATLVEEKYPEWMPLELGDPRPTQKAIRHQLEKEKDGRLRGKIEPPPNRSRD